jgi:molybdopterin-guanine dinucleotide biosynthesis protein A
VGGLAAALGRARGGIAFVSACDTPFLSSALVRALLARAEEDDTPDVVLPVWRGRDQPLLAAYRVDTMAGHFAARLAAGGGRLTDGLDERSVVRLREGELRRIDPDGDSFVNVNDPQDYRESVVRRAPVRPRDRFSSPGDRRERSRRGSSGDA